MRNLEDLAEISSIGLLGSPLGYDTGRREELENPTAKARPPRAMGLVWCLQSVLFRALVPEAAGTVQGGKEEGAAEPAGWDDGPHGGPKEV